MFTNGGKSMSVSKGADNLWEKLERQLESWDFPIIPTEA
tara:strand:+ start:1403 stop:1519 length:117 start_codon:yes stop_codon:yes gene_type:complete